MSGSARGTLIGVVVMSALLALYLALAGWRAVALFGSGEALATVFGIALLVLPLIGAWGLVVELRFGLRSARLSRVLGAEDGLPEQPSTPQPSGRVDRDAADAEFPRYAAEAEENPGDWRAWFRLGLAYDAAGDRRRARRAVRHAIALERG